ncbi:protein of unknown function [Candidatus Filomicrobium marinum]|uniref:Uncharacterized protein n=1 Tax=Candidatus Filomicrobium marinum TaxID=1608628 RepID=A0A0D6JBQ1_9HYPH|nr:protein of unknown function [Candidatus Filomicrobium marinum]CPR16589.1 protein of unknown function [Candidatus Filomicrobium marinum]
MDGAFEKGDVAPPQAAAATDAARAADMASAFRLIMAIAPVFLLPPGLSGITLKYSHVHYEASR